MTTENMGSTLLSGWCGMQMVLKCADIGHLAVDPITHKRWAFQLEEEFFRQVYFTFNPVCLSLLFCLSLSVCMCLHDLKNGPCSRSAYMRSCLSAYVPGYVSASVCVCLSTWVPVCLPCLSVGHLIIYMPGHASACVCVSVCLGVCLPALPVCWLHH